MSICPRLLYVVWLLSVLLLESFESPGVGQASFVPKSPLDPESTILVNTPRVECCHEGGFCIDRSLPWMTEEVKSQGGAALDRTPACLHEQLGDGPTGLAWPAPVAARTRSLPIVYLEAMVSICTYLLQEWVLINAVEVRCSRSLMEQPFFVVVSAPSGLPDTKG